MDEIGAILTLEGGQSGER